MPITRIDYDVCSDCGRCYDACPTNVIEKSGALVYIAYPDDCMTCFLCVRDCPDNAITVTAERAGHPVLPW
ncbi:MAG: ferredoxin family protein [Chloroflexi bacterium]|nr:ferredoxin family protein [Chloroflexota bacterium]